MNIYIYWAKYIYIYYVYCNRFPHLPLEQASLFLLLKLQCLMQFTLPKPLMDFFLAVLLGSPKHLLIPM